LPLAAEVGIDRLGGALALDHRGMTVAAPRTMSLSAKTTGIEVIPNSSMTM
jgi:hypothetical protein